MDKTLPNRIME